MIRFIIFVILTAISFLIAQEAIVNNAILESLVRFAAIVCFFYGAKMVWLPSKPRQRKLKKWRPPCWHNDPGLKGLLLLAAAAMAPMPAEAGMVEDNVAQGMEQASEALKRWPNQGQIRWNDLRKMEIVYVDHLEPTADGEVVLGHAECHLAPPRVTIAGGTILGVVEEWGVGTGAWDQVRLTAIHEAVHVAVGCAHDHDALFQDVMSHVTGTSDAGRWPESCDWWTKAKPLPYVTMSRGESCLSRSWPASSGMTLHRDFRPREDCLKWTFLLLLIGVLMSHLSAIEGLRDCDDVRLDMVVLNTATLVALGLLLLSSLVDFLSLGGSSWAQEMASSLASMTGTGAVLSAFVVLVAQALCASSVAPSGLAAVRMVPKFAVPVIVFLFSSPAFGQTVLLTKAEGVDMSTITLALFALFALFAAAWIVSKTVGVQMQGVGLHGLLFPPRVRRWVRIRRRRGTGRVRAPRGVEAVLLPVAGVFGRVYADRWGWQWRQPPVLWTGGTWEPTRRQLGRVAVALVGAVALVAGAASLQGDAAMAMAAGPLLDRLVARLIFGDSVLSAEYRREEAEITEFLNQFDAFEGGMSLGEVITGQGALPSMDIWKDKMIECHAYSRDMFDGEVFVKVTASSTRKKTTLWLSSSEFKQSTLRDDDKTFRVEFAPDLCSLGTEYFKKSRDYALDVEGTLVGPSSEENTSWAKTPRYSEEQVRALISDLSTLIGPAGADALAERFRAEVQSLFTQPTEEELAEVYQGLLKKMGFSSEELLRHQAEDKSCLPWTPVTLWHGARSLFWTDGTKGLISYLMVVEPDERYFVKAIPEWAPEGAYFDEETGDLYGEDHCALHAPVTEADRREWQARAEAFSDSKRGREQLKADAEYWRLRKPLGTPEEIAVAAQAKANMELLGVEVSRLYSRGAFGDLNDLLEWCGLDGLKVRAEVSFSSFNRGWDRAMTSAHEDDDGKLTKLTRVRWQGLLEKMLAVLAIVVCCFGGEEGIAMAGVAPSLMGQLIREIGRPDPLLDPEYQAMGAPDFVLDGLDEWAREGADLESLSPGDAEAVLEKLADIYPPDDLGNKARRDAVYIQTTGCTLRDVILRSRNPGDARTWIPQGFTLAAIAGEVVRVRVRTNAPTPCGLGTMTEWDIRGDDSPAEWGDVVEGTLVDEVHFRFRPEIRGLARRLLDALETWKSHIPREQIETEWLYIGAEFPEGFFSDLDGILWAEAQAYLRREAEESIEEDGKHRFYYDTHAEDGRRYTVPGSDREVWASPDRAPGCVLDRCIDVGGQGWHNVGVDLQEMDLRRLDFEDLLLVGGADRSKYPLEYRAPGPEWTNLRGRVEPALPEMFLTLTHKWVPAEGSGQCAVLSWWWAVNVLLLGWEPSAPSASSKWRKSWDKVARRIAPVRKELLKTRRKISRLRRQHEDANGVRSRAVDAWATRFPAVEVVVASDWDQSSWVEGVCEDCLDPDTVGSLEFMKKLGKGGGDQEFQCEGSWSGPTMAIVLDSGLRQWANLAELWHSVGGGVDPVAEDPTLGFTEEDWERERAEQIRARGQRAEAGAQGGSRLSFEEWQVSCPGSSAKCRVPVRARHEIGHDRDYAGHEHQPQRQGRPGRVFTSAGRAGRGSRVWTSVTTAVEKLAGELASLYRGGKMEEINQRLAEESLPDLAVKIPSADERRGFRRGWWSAAIPAVHGTADLRCLAGWKEVLLK